MPLIDDPELFNNKQQKWNSLFSFINTKNHCIIALALLMPVLLIAN